MLFVLAVLQLLELGGPKVMLGNGYVEVLNSRKDSGEPKIQVDREMKDDFRIRVIP